MLIACGTNPTTITSITTTITSTQENTTIKPSVTTQTTTNETTTTTTTQPTTTTPTQPTTTTTVKPTTTTQDLNGELPIYYGKIEGETALSSTQPKCFAGAWYHKVVSTKDKWVGMEGTVTLPLYDINRYKNSDGSTLTDPETDILYNLKNLDNASIYMGGSAKNESDVGLALSNVLDGKGVISSGGVAFRPFWRYITSSQYHDKGGYDIDNGRNYSVSCTGNNCYGNYYYKRTEFYYLPGDKIKMIIVSPKPHYLQLKIEVLEVSTLPFSVEMRKTNKWNDPANFESPIFRSDNHNNNQNAEFKRVNAIDQSGNEGKPAISTTTHIKEAIWHESYLYRYINNVLTRVPMNSKRVYYMNCPNPNAFIVERTDEMDVNGGETIEIKPSVLVNSNVVYYYKKEEEII
jgi:hypothetical protein